MANDSTTMSAAHTAATRMSPPSAAEKMAMGMVWVRPGMLPASMSVAPNSPMARAKASTVPATRPGAASGTSTRRKTVHSLAPRVRAASSSVGFTCSNAPSVVRYMSGNATTVAAMTVAGHENTMLMPRCSSACPMGLRLPKRSSRKKPTTVGGSTRGSVRMPSIHARMLPRTPYSRRAASTPSTNVAAVAVKVVASEMSSGERSMCIANAPF